MSRVEELEGIRWARQTAEQIMGLAGTRNGIAEVINVVRRGTMGDKPEAYKAGVRKFIHDLEIAVSMHALRVKQSNQLSRVSP